MTILSIDQGTSATKAVVVGGDGTVQALAEVPVSPRPTTDGGVEQDPEELWASVLEAGRQAVAAAGVDIAAVGFANQGETVLAWDRETGAPLGPAVSWQDRRAAEVCAELASAAAEHTAVTGLPLDPYFAAPKMTWLRRRVGDRGVITTTDSWLLHRLTGAYVSDVTTASRTMLLDLDRRAWSETACAAFGFQAQALPRIVACDEVIGETDQFGRTVVVSGLAVDQQAALLGERCLALGDAKCTYGTGAFLLANAGPRAVRSGSGLAASVAWDACGHVAYCLDGQVFTAGEALAWLRRWGLLARAEDLDRLAGSVPDTGGVTVVPALCGLGAPWWRPDALATIDGIGLGTEPAHVVRATVEGIAAQVALLVRALSADLGRPLTRLKVDGGLTRSSVVAQTQADLLQLPVEVATSTHSTALGVAALARLGAGLVSTLEDAIAPTPPVAVYEPRVSAAHAAERLGRFEDAVARLIGTGATTSPGR
ncbi:MAG: FGGY family carbohydrate kinase [Acidimicrobiales bacterium]